MKFNKFLGRKIVKNNMKNPKSTAMFTTMLGSEHKKGMNIIPYTIDNHMSGLGGVPCLPAGREPTSNFRKIPIERSKSLSVDLLKIRINKI